MFYGIIIIYSKVCCNCNYLFSIIYPVSGWFVRIMGDCKRINIQCSQRKWLIYIYLV